MADQQYRAAPMRDRLRGLAETLDAIYTLINDQALKIEILAHTNTAPTLKDLLTRRSSLEAIGTLILGRAQDMSLLIQLEDELSALRSRQDGQDEMPAEPYPREPIVLTPTADDGSNSRTNSPTFNAQHDMLPTPISRARLARAHTSVPAAPDGIRVQPSSIPHAGSVPALDSHAGKHADVDTESPSQDQPLAAAIDSVCRHSPSPTQLIHVNNLTARDAHSTQGIGSSLRGCRAQTAAATLLNTLILATPEELESARDAILNHVKGRATSMPRVGSSSAVQYPMSLEGHTPPSNTADCGDSMRTQPAELEGGLSAVSDTVDSQPRLSSPVERALLPTPSPSQVSHQTIISGLDCAANNAFVFEADDNITAQTDDTAETRVWNPRTRGRAPRGATYSRLLRGSQTLASSSGNGSATPALPLNNRRRTRADMRTGLRDSEEDYNDDAEVTNESAYRKKPRT